MSRLILLAMVVVGLVFLSKAFKRESGRVVERVKRAKQERKTGAKGTLVKDPKTGEYYVENNNIKL